MIDLRRRFPLGLGNSLGIDIRRGLDVGMAQEFLLHGRGRTEGMEQR